MGQSLPKQLQSLARLLVALSLVVTFASKAGAAGAEPPVAGAAALPPVANVPSVAWNGRTVGEVVGDLEAVWGTGKVLAVQRKTLANVKDLQADGFGPYHPLATQSDPVQLTGGQMMHVYVGGSAADDGGGLLTPTAPKVIAVVGWIVVIILGVFCSRCRQQLARCERELSSRPPR